jgi:hypothetical protein
MVSGRRPTLEVARSCRSNKALRRQLLQQRLRVFQIARVESFSEPPVHRSQQFARLLHLVNRLVVMGARCTMFRIGSVFSVESAPFAAICAAVS